MTTNPSNDGAENILPGSHKCVRCGDTLAEGVRFCVACGTHNFDPDAAGLYSARAEMRSHAKRSFLERFTFWWRYFMGGIRR